MLLENFRLTLEELDSLNPTSSSWAVGKRHIFLSEGARQQLELLRNANREYAAVIIQTAWKGWNERKKWPLIKTVLQARKYPSKFGSTHSNSQSTATVQSNPAAIVSNSHQTSSNNNQGATPFGHNITFSTSLGALNKPRPQPITGTPPPETCDQRIIAHTCSLFGLDLVIILLYFYLNFNYHPSNHIHFYHRQKSCHSIFSPSTF